MSCYLLFGHRVRSRDDRVHQAGPSSPAVVCVPLVNLSSSNLTSTRLQEVEANYNIEHGYKYDAKVIYGDTDSVMVKFGCPDLETAMALGKLFSSS